MLKFMLIVAHKLLGVIVTSEILDQDQTINLDTSFKSVKIDNLEDLIESR